TVPSYRDRHRLLLGMRQLTCSFGRSARQDETNTPPNEVGYGSVFGTSAQPKLLVVLARQPDRSLSVQRPDVTVTFHHLHIPVNAKGCKGVGSLYQAGSGRIASQVMCLRFIGSR